MVVESGRVGCMWEEPARGEGQDKVSPVEGWKVAVVKQVTMGLLRDNTYIKASTNIKGNRIGSPRIFTTAMSKGRKEHDPSGHASFCCEGIEIGDSLLQSVGGSPCPRASTMKHI